MKRNLVVATMLAIVLILSACGSKNDAKTTDTTEGNSNNVASDTQKESTQTNYPLTIQNYKRVEGGTTWEKKEQVFDKAPERVLATTKPAAELLLHLGLADKIAAVGADFGEADKSVSAEYEKLKKLSTGYINKEVALGANPDVIFGRGGLFDNADWGVGTVDSINDMGIKTYVLESSVTGSTYESVYKDIENVGKIFNVQEKAASYIKELQARQQGIESKLATITDAKTFVYLHMSDDKEVVVYPAGNESFLNDSMKMVKLTNAFDGQTADVGIETLIATDPDVLIIPNWTATGGTTPDKIKEGLYANPKLSRMKAIKNKQVYAVEYNYLFGYGYNTIDGMEILAKEMYPDLFK